jgi:hypothetical protein
MAFINQGQSQRDIKVFGIDSSCFRVIVLNATFNNISAISWRPVLLVEETGVLGENHRPTSSHWQIYHIMMYRVHFAWAGFKLTTLVVIGTDCISSYKWNERPFNITTRCMLVYFSTNKLLAHTYHSQCCAFLNELSWLWSYGSFIYTYASNRQIRTLYLLDMMIWLDDCRRRSTQIVLKVVWSWDPALQK